MTETRGTSPSQVVLKLGDIDMVRLSVSKVQHVSVLSMIAESVAGIHRGLPDPWVQRTRSAVAGSGRRALASIGAAPNVGWMPDCLVPLRLVADVELEVYLQAIHASEPSQVQRNLAQEFAGPMPRAWQAASDEPVEWIEACGEAVRVAAEATAPLWDRAGPLVDREIDRIGTAAVRGGTETLLNTLNSRMTCSDNELRYTHSIPGVYDLDGRELILVPIVAGDRMVMTNFDDSQHVWIGYPVPGLGQIWGGGPARPAAGSPLVALLGDTRAAVLQHLSRPDSIGNLAALLGCQPATMSFHCDRLESAGLIRRDRRGRAVFAHRTEIGDRLLELYLR